MALVSSSTRLDLTKKKNMLLLVFSAAVEYKLVKLETSHTALLPPTVSIALLLLLFGCYDNGRPAVGDVYTKGHDNCNDQQD